MKAVSGSGTRSCHAAAAADPADRPLHPTPIPRCETAPLRSKRHRNGFRFGIKDLTGLKKSRMKRVESRAVGKCRSMLFPFLLRIDFTETYA